LSESLIADQLSVKITYPEQLSVSITHCGAVFGQSHLSGAVFGQNHPLRSSVRSKSPIRSSIRSESPIAEQLSVRITHCRAVFGQNHVSGQNDLSRHRFRSESPIAERWSSFRSESLQFSDKVTCRGLGFGLGCTSRRGARRYMYTKCLSVLTAR